MKKRMKPLSIRKGDTELRTCDEYLSDVGPLTRMEIVQWNPDPNKVFCWTIAFWERNGIKGLEDECFLSFVGDRPFDKNVKNFMKLAKFGQKKLNKFYRQVGK